MKQSPRPSRAGFTLIEILVVIAIIMVLGTIVFLGAGRATLAAHKAEAVNDIKQLCAVSMADAGENNGIFPQHHYGNLPFWISWQWRDEAQVTREMAYCGGNKDWDKNGMDVGAKPSRNLWEFTGEEGESASSLFSYACLIDDPIWTENGSFAQPANWAELQDDVYNEDDETYRWTPRRLGQKVAYPILWMDVTMDWNNRKICNFMGTDRDDEPRGAHLGMLDGSVKWVDGNDLRARFSSPGLTLYW